MNPTKTAILVASVLTQIVILGLAYHWLHGPAAAPINASPNAVIVDAPTVDTSGPVPGVPHKAGAYDSLPPRPLSPLAFDSGDPQATQQDLAQSAKSAEARRQCAELLTNPPPVGGTGK